MALGHHANAQAQTDGQSVASELSFEQAVHETISWATGELSQQRTREVYERIERSAYRYGIEPEFALVVVAAEASLSGTVSWARYNSWNIYELTTGQNLVEFPHVLNDLDTALSELREELRSSGTTDEVFRKYWSGEKGEFNTDTLALFSEIASKLFNGLEPYRKARQETENRDKYDPTRYNQSDSAKWRGVLNGDLTGYQSQIGAMPELASQLMAFDEENDYAKVAKSYNKKLSDAEALIIARSILTYCYQTNWEVDPRLVMAIVRSESAFRPDAVSKVGAMGLGQLMPATARSFGIKDAFDPIQNLYGCVKYLEREHYRWRGFPDALDRIIASYNAGAGAVQKYKGVPPYRETQNFLLTVKKYYKKHAPEMN